MFSVDFSEITSISQIFKDYLANKPFMKERFPFNQELFAIGGEINERAANFSNRNLTIDLIKNSMAGIKLHQKQEQNLELLNFSNSMAVTTSQKVSIFGGPVFIYLKICSAISLTEKLNLVHRSLRFVPVFWIDDIQANSSESNSVNYISKNGSLKNQLLFEPKSKQENIITAKRFYSSSDVDNILAVISDFPDSERKNQILADLKEIYCEGISWSDCFMHLLNKWFAESGLLFIKASTALQEGAFRKIAEKELETIGHSNYVIKQANYSIEQNGYSMQMRSGDINLYKLSEDFRRQKIEISRDNSIFNIEGKRYYQSELQDMLGNNSGSFLPKVMLSNLFISHAVPNAAYIAGPSEIGFLAQSKELFQLFNIDFPAIMQRHSITFIDVKTKMFMDKQHLNILYFMKNFQIIETELREKFYDSTIEELFENINERFGHLFDELRVSAIRIERSLEQRTEAIKNSTAKMLKSLEKRMQESSIFRYDDIFKRYKMAADILFPESNLQERVFTPLTFLNLTSEQNFTKVINGIISYMPNRHYFVNLI